MRRMMRPKKSTPPGNRRDGARATWERLTLNRVSPFSIRSGCRSDRETQPLPQRAADETADAVGLPVGKRHEVVQADAARARQHFDDLHCFTAIARVAYTPSSCRLDFFGRNPRRLRPPSETRCWIIAFQIRVTAILRLVNLLTGFWPGKQFQISIGLEAGQHSASRENSSGLLNASVRGLVLASFSETKPVILFLCVDGKGGHC
jgi:hypothetical protein